MKVCIVFEKSEKKMGSETIMNAKVKVIVTVKVKARVIVRVKVKSISKSESESECGRVCKRACVCVPILL